EEAPALEAPSPALQNRAKRVILPLLNLDLLPLGLPDLPPKHRTVVLLLDASPGPLRRRPGGVLLPRPLERHEIGPIRVAALLELLQEGADDLVAVGL